MSSPIWHPCSQMKDYETFKPLMVKQARGSYIELENGRKIIDAISSWWCKSLGHNHPRLKTAVQTQIEKFEHVILANTTNETIIELSEKITNLTQNLKKVFYASEGSSAVEIALKMSVHARQILGEKNRQKFISLSNSYHGETTGALSVSDIGIYRNAYEPILFETIFLSSIPYVSDRHDPLWGDCETHWQDLLKQLEPIADSVTAVIVEPIIQGASGMQIYSQDLLRRLRVWTKQHDIHLIADEILTGMGRTGKMLSCEHAEIEADFVCLGKGLTSGWLPLSAVLTSQKIYDLFYDDYEKGKSFLHSHTFGGNALAASVALETYKIFEEDNICGRVQKLESWLLQGMRDVASTTGKLKNVRGIGGIVAADLIVDDPKKRMGYAVYQEAVKRGALLRPLGNTIYWFPPLNVSEATLIELKEITEAAILAVRG